MEELLQKLLEEQQKTNELLMDSYNGKDPNELLTIKQVQKETGFGIETVQRMFKDPAFNAQRYVTPFRVTRHAFNKYMNENHDYLRRK